MKRVVFFLVWTVMLAAPGSIAAGTFSFTDVNYPGASLTVASGINDSGQIVGYYSDTSGVGHGFLLSAGTYTTIDCPSPYTTSSLASGINSSGQIVGYCAAPGGISVSYGATRSFLLSGGVLTFLPDAPGSYRGASTFAYSINDTGQIVGSYADGCLCTAHGFLLSAGTFTTIDVPGFAASAAYGINNSGQITGLTQLTWGASFPHGFLLNGGTYTLIDDPDSGTPYYTWAQTINNFGKVVGVYYSNNGANQHGFLLDGGTFTTIDHPNALGTGAFGINSQGQIVGAYSDLNNVPHGFVTKRLFSVALLYDWTRAAKSGSTIPIKLQLLNESGSNLSSSGITAHSISVTEKSTAISGLLEDSGNANPDNDFRFDPSLGGTGGYIFNLSTKGLSTGTYSLNFTVTGDSIVYAAPFQVR